MVLDFSAPVAAKIAIQSLGCGYDISLDLSFKYCKGDSDNPHLIEVDESQGREIVLPGGISVPDVPKWITCDKGESTRFQSGVLSFKQMSEKFNQEMSVAGKIPSGLFNSMFELSGSWQRDASNTKTLAFDGVFITLYTVALENFQLVLSDRVKKAIPSSWEPAALSRFIEKFGTHIIVGVKMGGKDVIFMRQHQQSTLQPAEVEKRLKTIADKKILDSNGAYSIDPEQLESTGHRLWLADTGQEYSFPHTEEIVSICKRRGGFNDRALKHNEWLQTVQSKPDVISMSFIPITSLLNGVPGSGFLSHAINLYLQYKPPIEELHQFLEFQLPRQWAPLFSELPLGAQSRQFSTPLQFSFLGPKLYVNTTPVDVGKRPVTGLRLYLDGKRCNRLSIQMQHLSSLPKILRLEDDPNGNFSHESCDRRYYDDRRYYEKVRWKNFSHVCTKPVEPDEDLAIVSGAQLEVGDYGYKKVLFLRLRFSTVDGTSVVRHPEWDGSPGLAHKSGLISALISSHFSSTFKKPPPQHVEMNSNSPVPVQAQKMLKFVDTTELKRGPHDSPGYWLVSGARLMVENGRICLRVKYSLLTVLSDDVPEDL